MHVSRHETHALDRPLAGNLSAISRKWIRSCARRRLFSARPPSLGLGAVLQFRSEGRAARHNRRIVIEIQEEIKAACPRSRSLARHD